MIATFLPCVRRVRALARRASALTSAQHRNPVVSQLRFQLEVMLDKRLPWNTNAAPLPIPRMRALFVAISVSTLTLASAVAATVIVAPPKPKVVATPTPEPKKGLLGI